MKLLVGILLLVGLALLATSAKFLKLRRSTIVGVLVSGGWLGVLAGVIIGPRGLKLISPSMIIESAPLLMIGMGWIGLMIGLQLRRDVLKQLPAPLKRLSAIDVVGSVAVFGIAAALLMPQYLRVDTAATLWAPIVLLMTASIGWTVEMRSLRLANTSNAQEALILRGAPSLASPLAVLLFSVGAATIQGSDAAALEMDFFSSAFRHLSLVLIAVVLGILARFGLRRAEGHRSELLAVFLGVVAVLAGAAVSLEVSPLASAMFAGIVIANLAGREMRQFERFILQAEHVVATVFWVVAGVLIDTRIGLVGGLMILVFTALRALLKPLLVRIGKISANETPDAATNQLLRWAPVRQSPLAIMLAVTLVIMVPSDLNHQLLMIVACVGLLTDLIAVIASSGWRSAISGNGAAQATPEGAPA